MPKRTNSFQELIYRIEVLLADAGTTVRQSVEERDPDSGAPREIDILIETHGPHPTRIAVECRDRGRRGDIEWVDQAIGKYEHMKIHKIVFVHSKGFTPAAQRKATSLGHETLTLQQAMTADWLDRRLTLRAVIHNLVQYKFCVAYPEAFLHTPLETPPPEPFKAGDAVFGPGDEIPLTISDLVDVVLHAPEAIHAAVVHWSGSALRRNFGTLGELAVLPILTPLPPGTTVRRSLGLGEVTRIDRVFILAGYIVESAVGEIQPRAYGTAPVGVADVEVAGGHIESLATVDSAGRLRMSSRYSPAPNGPQSLSIAYWGIHAGPAPILVPFPR